MKYLFLFLTAAVFLIGGGNGTDEKNIWLSVYKNHLDYERLLNEKIDIEAKIAENQATSQNEKERHELNNALLILQAELDTYDNMPKNFSELLSFQLPNIEKIELNLISFITKNYDRELVKSRERTLTLKSEYEAALKYLENEIADAKKSKKQRLAAKIEEDVKYFVTAEKLIAQKLRAIDTVELFLKTKEENYRKDEFPRFIFAVSIVIGMLMVLWLARRAIRRYVDDAEVSAFWIRIINIFTMSCFVLWVIFSYVDNVLYALTFVGFIAAGLTIAMKEILLNLAAWIKLSFTNMINIGDRILVIDNRAVIGDVIDISPMSFTLYENITHNSATELKRAGRTIFVPTNMIFTKVFYNYTHDTMKTLYDLIEVPFTIDSNFEKISAITEETVYAMTSRYIDMAKLQYDRLRDRYTMRGKKMRPKIQFMLQEDGQAIRMYLWYVSPYRDILNVRSNLTLELLRRYGEDESIKLFRKD